MKWDARERLARPHLRRYSIRMAQIRPTDAVRVSRFWYRWYSPAA